MRLDYEAFKFNVDNVPSNITTGQTHIGGWIIADSYFYETFEEKIGRMKLDSFIKKYPMFSAIKEVIKLGKTNMRIYSKTIMDMVRFEVIK